ncbi:hypothetical protein SanaruYs_34630 [Chryseotalea sanaruensis]|uniref:ATP-binding protein n=1 Tax=Chryseotalea sanaruensis TaxID=2482724 RepID=A0A401UEC6_9BACT|nr:hypothetical protein [Chryseotalea sanaruensis]GCC53220.1 hypothetical protein SanaruYs_34630 [Chryseotalea sanaruensis]
MQTKFTTSTNILRDSSRSLNYIPTPNSLRTVNQIANDFKKGLRSFNIIGSYGTGKSSFLWAFNQSLIGKKKYFNFNILNSPKVGFLNFVGEYKSITDVFIEHFEISSKRNVNENIFSEIYNLYYALGKKNPLLVIVIDEFGKFLEHASLNDPEKELYFIQQLAEFVNNPDYNILLITSVHQNFDAYSFSLTNSQKQEWTKVKGRFREITFNEPVEQLLYLASEHLKQSARPKNIDISIKKSISILKKSKAFPINQNYVSEVSSKLFPLDLVAANILTILLQKYGQNERSLFSFLESTDHTGIKRFDQKSNPFFNVSNVYDYLIFNFYHHINSRYNPDFTAWASIKNGIEKVEKMASNRVVDCLKVVKTIGLLNITASAGSEIDKNFLINYSEVCLGIREPDRVINELIKSNVITYRSYKNRFILSEGTDLDIPLALIEAGNKVSQISDISTRLNRHFEFPQILAKSHSYQRGTPRIFEFKISTIPIKDIPVDEIDGYINLIFSDTLSVANLIEESQNQEEAIIYALYLNSVTIKNQLFEIEKTIRVLDENDHDRAAVKELKQILLHQKNLLTHFILHNLYSKNDDLVWIYRGKVIEIESKKSLNKYLSKICDEVYTSTPVFKNELINRHKISSSAHTAKRNYFKALVDNWNKPELGFDKDKFPAEKTIYLTLLKENGIKLYSEDLNHKVKVSKNSSFYALWDYSNKFLQEAKISKRPLSEFVIPLSRRPFKLKQGFIDFWLASFFFIKRDDFALFGDTFIPYINEEVLELIVKYPNQYEVKAFDIDGVRLDIFNSYRIFLNQHSKEKIGNESFIETIKPFLTFYRGLPDYSKTTKRLKKETIAIRSAISSSKDPEKSFFEDFPMALGYNLETLQASKQNLKNYIIKLQDSIRELRTSYDNLLARFEDFILTEFIGEKLPFNVYKEKIQLRYKKLKRHLCLPHQKIFIQRLDSEIDDEKAWLSSIANALLGKPLGSISDEEEVLLYDRFKSMILELDSLTILSKEDIDEENEDVIGIQLSSFIDGINRSSIRMPKIKIQEVTRIEELIRLNLSKNRALNIAALAHILKDLLKK